MVKELEVDLLAVFDYLYNSYIHEKSYKLLFPYFSFLIYSLYTYCVIYKSTHPENYIPTVMSPLKHTSLPSTAATFLATHLMAVLQPSEYSVFHSGDTLIQLGLP